MVQYTACTTANAIHTAKFSISPIQSLGMKNQGDEGMAETYSVFRLDKFPMCVGMDPLSLLLWRSLCKQLKYSSDSHHHINIMCIITETSSMNE